MQFRIVILLSIFACGLRSLEPALQRLSQSLEFFEQKIPWLMGECFSMQQQGHSTTIQLHTDSPCIPLGGNKYSIDTIISEVSEILRQHLRPDISNTSSSIDWAWIGPKMKLTIPFYLEQIPKAEDPSELLKQFALTILYQEKTQPAYFSRKRHKITEKLLPEQQELWLKCQTDIANYFHQKKRYYLGKLHQGY